MERRSFLVLGAAAIPAAAIPAAAVAAPAPGASGSHQVVVGIHDKTASGDAQTASASSNTILVLAVADSGAPSRVLARTGDAVCEVRVWQVHGSPGVYTLHLERTLDAPGPRARDVHLEVSRALTADHDEVVGVVERPGGDRTEVTMRLG
jgi:hypothetical protein